MVFCIKAADDGVSTDKVGHGIQPCRLHGIQSAIQDEFRIRRVVLSGRVGSPELCNVSLLRCAD